jgi:transcriptional regulator with XRE-family HTH domain
MSIGENIQFYRKKHGYSQKELAEKLNYSTGTIQQYELDKREPKFKIMCEIASALDVKPYMLYEYDHDPTEFNFIKACDWLRNADFKINPPDEDDGLHQYEISSFDGGTICKMDEIDIIDLVSECRQQAEADTDEQTIKYIKMALLNKK